MKRAAIYCRVSTTGQAETGTSLGSQSDECHAYARKHGYTVIEEIKEDISGATLDRPGLRSVRDLVRAAAVEAVIVYDPDRLGRNLGHQLLVMEEFDKAGVALEFVNTPNDQSPAGLLMLQVRGAVAQFEREKIRERTVRGKQARVRQGKVLDTGHTAFGFNHVQGEGRLEINEEQAATVRNIYDWYVHKGMTLYGIAERLSTLGIPNLNRTGYWRAATIRRMLLNPVYKGQWAYGKRTVKVPGQSARQYSDPSEWIYVSVPPIVSDELWEAARERLAVNKFLSTRNTKAEYLLSGFLFCAYCGRRCTGERNAAHRYYHCYNYHYAKSRPDYRCPMTATRADDLENTVWNELTRQIFSPDLIDRVRSQTETERLTEQIEAELGTLKKAAAAIQRETDRLLDLYLSDDLTKPMFSKRMEGIKVRAEGIARQQSDAQARLRELNDREQAVADLATYIEDIRLGLPDLPFKQRKDLLIRWKVRVVYQPTDDTVTIEGFPLPTGAIPLERTVKKRKRRTA